MRIFLLVMGDPKLHIFEIPYRDTLEGISHVSKKKQKNTFFLCKIELKCAHLAAGARGIYIATVIPPPTFYSFIFLNILPRLFKTLHRNSA